RFARRIDVRARVAGAGPFPYVAGNILKAAAVGAEMTLCFGSGIAFLARIVSAVGDDPSCRRIVGFVLDIGRRIVAKSLCCCKDPLLVRRQAPALTGLRG